MVLFFVVLQLPCNAQVKFVQNMGQWDEQVRYRAVIPGGFLFVEDSGLTYLFYDGDHLHNLTHGHGEGDKIQYHSLKLRLKNSNSNSKVQAENRTSEHYNYYLGSNPAKWASKVYAWQKVTIKNVYKGVDLELIGEDEGIKYNFIVAPGADPSNIIFSYTGADAMAIKDGRLQVKHSLGEISEEAPLVYQDHPKGRTEIKASFSLSGNNVSFNLRKHNKSEPLVIDPIVVFSTFSGSPADNFGFTATYDNLGHAYGGGIVYNHGFPTTVGAFQEVFHGPEGGAGFDCGILKYSPDGTKLLYATYLGGSANEQPHSMVVNPAGDLVILGTTFSSDFPVTSGAFDTDYNGDGDVFVAILKEDGTALLNSTFVGGPMRDGLNGESSRQYNAVSGPLAFNYGDEYRGEVITDNDGNVFIATSTQSAKNYPNQVQGPQGGTQDGLVVKFNPSLTEVLFSSYLGGSSHDAVYGLALNSKGDLYVAGGTTSTNIGTSANAYQANNNGGIDGLLYKLNAAGAISAVTYLGTNQYDQIYFVQTDEVDRVYVAGQTRGMFPVSSGVFSNVRGKQFINIFDPDLSNLIKGTVFGSGDNVPNISPSAFLVDRCGRVYVSGWGGGTNNDYNSSQTGTTSNLPTTSDAFQRTTDGSDFYLIIFSRFLATLEYASYFGGPRSHEHVDGGTSRFDKDGIVYQSVCAGCGVGSDFPTTDGAWSRQNKGRRTSDPSAIGCNNAVFKVDLNSSNFAPEFQDTVLVVSPGDAIDYSFTVTDRDKSDSIYFYLSGDVFANVSPPVATYQGDSGMQTISGRFRWNPNCEHLLPDTHIVEVHMRDNGCPTPRTATGTIKIVVQEPPVPEAPGIFCLKRLDENTLGINWNEFQIGRFTSHYVLMKRYPDGQEEKLLEITDSAEKEYLDNNVPGHAIQDYCYYLFGVSICGKSGDSTRLECSIPDEDSLPRPSYLYTVTVEGNKDIRLLWMQSDVPGFYSYEIFKKENGTNNPWESLGVIKNRKDTTFLDEKVNVHKKSYCYKLEVTDQCGLKSMDNNIGCSILLTGESIPFEHQLWWNKYEDWMGGVESYDVQRRDPLTPEQIIGNTGPGATNYIDDTLNYDVGLYYYTVKAHEGKHGPGATSLSNEIELLQQPLLHVPNAFTPGGDSINDVFNYVPVFVKDFHLQVFNRWGEQVYETFNRHDRWQGIYKNNIPWDNVFVYIITYTGWDDNVYYAKGNVTLLR